MQILEPSPKPVAGFAPRLPGTTNTGFEINADDLRWQLALRIAASRSLGRSQLLSDFLLYIVDRSIRGRTDQISEQQIGVTVFGRTEDYDSNDDNIVRSYARKLRKRIDEYFATEGREETLRLEIPRGGYAPVFSEHTSVQREEHPVAIPEAMVFQGVDNNLSSPPDETRSPSSAALRPWTRITGKITPATFLALLLGILLGSGITLLRHTKLVVPQDEALSHMLWKQMFNSDRDTFIVPSDDGLIVMQRLITRPVPLAAYVNGSYRPALKTDDTSGASEILKLGGRRFTSVVDLDFAAHLAQLKEVVSERMMIRYARDLRMDDLRTGNAILIGSDESDPWIELFRPQLHFYFQFESDPDKPSGFVNLYPRSGEASIYTTKGQEERTYGIIAYLPNLTGSGHVLIVAGLNTAGTQAAAAFLLDPRLMMPTLQRARTADGSLQPFELLVGAGNVATNASTPHIVLERIGLPQGH
jgi:hypothetical protein